MKLKIRRIDDNGNLDGERVIIDVKEDGANLSSYILLDTTYFDDGNVSNKHRHSYWFPNQPTEKGDVICVYTRAK
jgi:hypothetical protein